MACALTAGRKEPCKNIVGGLKNVYFIDYGTLGTASLTAGEITDLTGTFTAFKYELRGTSNLEQAINSSRENGTTFFEQTLTLNLKKQTKEFHNEIKLLASNRPHIAVEDYNGNVFMVGLEHGADVSGGSIISGSAMGDRSGYDLTFTGQEVSPANFIANPTAADPFDGMSSATVTITEGAVI